MEKLVYLLQKKSAQNAETFGDQLLKEVPKHLLPNAGVRWLRVGISDSEVDEAKPLRQEQNPPVPDVLVTLGVADDYDRASIEAVLEKHTDCLMGYLVAETEPLTEASRKAVSGERTPGMLQVAMFSKPSAQSHSTFLDIWLKSHTQIAIDTQSTFGYRQNAIVRPLTENATPFDAIVEEHFPEAAMTSPHVFFDAEGDEEVFQKHLFMMMESCVRFIDFETINVVPMSEYTFTA